MIKQNLNTNNYINKTESDNFLPDVYIEKNIPESLLAHAPTRLAQQCPEKLHQRL